MNNLTRQEDLYEILDYLEEKESQIQREIVRSDPNKYHFISNQVLSDHFMYHLLRRCFSSIQYKINNPKMFHEYDNDFILNSNEMKLVALFIDVKRSEPINQRDLYYINQIDILLNKELFDEDS